MSGNAKSKANKGKPKTNNGQLTQNASNGGHAVSSQSDHNSLFDMTHMGSGQGIGQGMPQGPNMYPPPYMPQHQSQHQNQAVSENLQLGYGRHGVCKYAGSVSGSSWTTNSADKCSV